LNFGQKYHLNYELKHHLNNGLKYHLNNGLKYHLNNGLKYHLNNGMKYHFLNNGMKYHFNCFPLLSFVLLYFPDINTTLILNQGRVYEWKIQQGEGQQENTMQDMLN
jgi:hypothetical protein